jgi:hypothetical protein
MFVIVLFQLSFPEGHVVHRYFKFLSGIHDFRPRPINCIIQEFQMRTVTLKLDRHKKETVLQNFKRRLLSIPWREMPIFTQTSISQNTTWPRESQRISVL